MYSSQSEILSVIEYFARTKPGETAIIHPSKTFDYATLHAMILALSRKLADRLPQGGRIVIDINDPFIALMTIIATAASGHSWMKAGAPAEPAANSLRVTDQPGPGDGTPTAMIDKSWFEPSPAGKMRAVPNPWMLAQSSGTTGKKKIIPLSEANILNRALAHQIGYGTPITSARVACFARPNFEFGLGCNLSTLVRGGTLVFCEPDFISADASGAQHVFASVSQFNTALKRLRFGAQFPTIQSVLVAGSHLTAASIKRFREHSKAKLFLSYGATEMGPVATGDVDVIRKANKYAVGFIAPWVRHAVIPDAAGESGMGEIRFQTPEMTAAADLLRDGWLHPGDVGKVDENGLLIIQGRTDERINLGGVKVSIQESEELLLALDGVTDAAVFLVPDALGNSQLYGAVVCADETDFEDLMQRCAEQLGGKAPKFLARTDLIPRTESGKIERYKLTQMFAPGAQQAKRILQSLH